MLKIWCVLYLQGIEKHSISESAKQPSTGPAAVVGNLGAHNVEAILKAAKVRIMEVIATVNGKKGREMTITAKQAKAAGYCITSRRAPTWATRIDRKDWREHMAAQQPGGMEWVKCLGKDAADHYRRVYSKDTIVVHSGWVKLLPNSGQGPAEFLPSNA